MRKLNAEISALLKSRETTPVFGEGPLSAKLMLIGEAPGEREAEEGRPFVGRAGKNLDAFISATGLERKDMYITNAVKFRPTRISGANRTVNRPPTRAEVALFLPFLIREIEIVNPEIIVTLGNVPLKALLGEKSSIGALHGKPMEYGKYTLYPMYHPAAIIYNQTLKGVYAEDMARLPLLITNFQRFN